MEDRDINFDQILQSSSEITMDYKSADLDGLEVLCKDILSTQDTVKIVTSMSLDADDEFPFSLPEVSYYYFKCIYFKFHNQPITNLDSKALWALIIVYYLPTRGRKIRLSGSQALRLSGSQALIIVH